jgi:hypothetical protein
MTGQGGEAADSSGITRRKLVGTGIAAVGATVVWGSPVPFARKGIGAALAADGEGGPTGGTHSGHQNTGVEEPPPAGEGRVGYCAVAGNTYPDGTPIPPGTFINLLEGQPDYDPNYKGATIANYIEGMGITCDPPPAGYVRKGFADSDDVPAGLYPFYGKP